MYRIIMSSDVRNGRIFLVRMSHRHWEGFIGIYLRVKTGHRIHTRFTITRHPRTGHQDKRRLILFVYIIVVSTHATLSKVWYILKCYFPFRKFVVEKIICENLFEHYVDCKNLNWKHASHIHSWVMHINEILFYN